MSQFKTKSGTWKVGALRKAGMSGNLHVVQCPGEAHDPAVGGMIDNCGICAPGWRTLMIPVECATLLDWRNRLSDIESGTPIVYPVYVTRGGHTAVVKIFRQESKARSYAATLSNPGAAYTVGSFILAE